MDTKESTSIHQNINIKREHFMDTCRVCMDRHEEMNSIFDSENDSILDRVQFCTGIEFTNDDGLPTQICNACIQNLTVAHKFKTLCLRSEELFRNILQDNIKEESDDDFNNSMQYDDDDDGKEVKDEVAENVLNENGKKIRVGEESESEIGKEIKKQKQTRGPYKKQTKRNRMKKYKFKRLTCEPCNMKFKTKLESTEHKKLAHADASWVCEVCGKVCTNEKAHYTHKQTHKPIKYACEHCDYKTPHKYALVKHMRVHTGGKSYQCEICPARYRTSWSLMYHRRLFHEGQKRYKCTMCDKGFYDKTKLNRHVDSHNKIKRYECEVCHSCFTRRCYWKKHMDTRHGVVIPAQRPGRRRLNDQIGEFAPNDGTIASLFAKQSHTTEN